MKNLYDNLIDLRFTSEGLLDADDIVKNGESAMVEDWLKTAAKGKYKIMRLKNGQFKIWGDMILKNYTGTSFSQGFIINYIQGNLYIENCPNLETLEGLFEWDDVLKCYAGKVDGSIYIENCPKLTSLKGLPKWIDKKLSVASCRSLRDLSDLNVMVGEISVMKCGKKFKQEQLKKVAPAATHIFCALEDDEEPLLLESFQDPILTMVWDQAVKNKCKMDPEIYFGQKALSRISSSVGMEFDMTDSTQKKKGEMAARAVLSMGGKGNGFVITWKNDEFQCVAATAGSEPDVYWISKSYIGIGGRGYTRRNSYKITEIMEYIKTVPDKIYVYDFNNSDRVENGEYSIWQIQREREQAREGMIDRSPYGYKLILQRQQERYKKLVNQMKTAKESEKYKKVADKVNAILQRVQKLTTKMVSDPVWGFKNKWDISRAMDSVMDKKVYMGYRNGKANYSGDNGVMTLFNQWAQDYMAAASGGAEWSSAVKLDNLNKKEEELNLQIQYTDNVLSRLGC